MWYRRSRVIATVSVVALAALAGCGGAGGDAADGGETVAGQPAVTAGFDGTTIRLGAISTLTGPVAVAGTPLTAGNQVWFDHTNATGGIAGRYPVELVVEDNQYKPDVTVQQYQKIKNDVVAFTQILGTPSVLAVLPQLAADGAAVLFVSSEMEELLGLAERILVMHDGVVTGELGHAEATEEGVMHLATGGPAQVAADV